MVSTVQYTPPFLCIRWDRCSCMICFRYGYISAMLFVLIYQSRSEDRCTSKPTPTGFRGSMFLFIKNLKRSELRVLFYSNSLVFSKIENTVKESQAFHKSLYKVLKRGFGMLTRHLLLVYTSLASSFRPQRVKSVLEGS